ncbi:beta-hydroxyacyl-ACP dehydratase [Dactylosporangium roseum]|uniref:Beta-hydroxyacyl-ACP dehydratase n=1 Tax=Dactylosporangium roseum TaxID=47989 RepID=A0ABY5Z1Z6_9ACTN|nr:beta-hydroxyacyl-ACP dehydratase [Dactylosporangium roseum]UWZ34773.1 beta-hydroxyacyl-ACP dehydratase [Dactylosporangium roseum]
MRGLLRQRYPMLLLDRVVAATPRSLVAVKAVTAAEQCYANLGDEIDAGGLHYPLALLVESFGQAVSVLWALGGGAPAGVPLLATLRDVVVGSPALPGDVLEHHVRLEHVSGRSAIFSGHTESAGRRILDIGSLMTAVRSESDLTA